MRPLLIDGATFDDCSCDTDESEELDAELLPADLDVRNTHGPRLADFSAPRQRRRLRRSSSSDISNGDPMAELTFLQWRRLSSVESDSLARGGLSQTLPPISLGGSVPDPFSAKAIGTPMKPNPLVAFVPSVASAVTESAGFLPQPKSPMRLDISAADGGLTDLSQGGELCSAPLSVTHKEHGSPNQPSASPPIQKDTEPHIEWSAPKSLPGFPASRPVPRFPHRRSSANTRNSATCRRPHVGKAPRIPRDTPVFKVPSPVQNLKGTLTPHPSTPTNDTATTLTTPQNREGIVEPSSCNRSREGDEARQGESISREPTQSKMDASCINPTPMLTINPVDVEVTHVSNREEVSVEESQTQEHHDSSLPFAKPNFGSRRRTAINELAGIYVGMKLEADDGDSVCVATVAKIDGSNRKILITFDGWYNTSSFWVDLGDPSMLERLHPVGWCASHGVRLEAPRAFVGAFSWATYLRHTGAKVVPTTVLATLVSHASTTNQVDDTESVEQLVATSSLPNQRKHRRRSPDVNPTSKLTEDVPTQEGSPLSKDSENMNNGTKTPLQRDVTQSKALKASVPSARITRTRCSSQRTSDENVAKDEAASKVSRSKRRFTSKEIEGIAVGMRLEAEDCKYGVTCVATISSVDAIDRRIKINFDGWHSESSFWVDLGDQSMLERLHPVGWCASHGVRLEAPRAFVGTFSWATYLRHTGAKIVPASVLSTLTFQASSTNQVDDTETVEQHVAVRGTDELLNEHIVAPHSETLDPAQPLTSQRGASRRRTDSPQRPTEGDAESEGASAGSSSTRSKRRFGSKAINGFEVGMRLEAEDYEYGNICVASISAIDTVDRRIKISFDGWYDESSFWVHLDNADELRALHPVGWCETAGVELSPPRGKGTPFSWRLYLSHTGAKAVPKCVLSDATSNACSKSMETIPSASFDHPSRVSSNFIRESPVRIAPSAKCPSTMRKLTSPAEKQAVTPRSASQASLRSTPPPSARTAQSLSPASRHALFSNLEWVSTIQRSPNKRKNQEEVETTDPKLTRGSGELSVGGLVRGMKLEADDIKTADLTCVATVADIYPPTCQVRIGFDGWGPFYDYWINVANPTEFARIHPVGWCAKNGREIDPPARYDRPFSWTAYLAETSSRPVPEEVFETLSCTHKKPRSRKSPTRGTTHSLDTPPPEPRKRPRVARALLKAK